MYILCVSYVYIYISYVYPVYILCISYVYPVYILCISYVYPFIPCISYVYAMIYVYPMFIPCNYIRISLFDRAVLKHLNHQQNHLYNLSQSIQRRKGEEICMAPTQSSGDVLKLK